MQRMAAAAAAAEGRVAAAIRVKLQEALQPSHLAVLNESHMHAVPKGRSSKTLTHRHRLQLTALSVSQAQRHTSRSWWSRPSSKG